MRRQMQENLFPSREVALQSSSIASMQDTLISLEAEHGRFRGTIAWLKDSVAKLEMAQQSEKDKHLGALGQVRLVLPVRRAKRVRSVPLTRPRAPRSALRKRFRG